MGGLRSFWKAQGPEHPAFPSFPQGHGLHLLD